jgi:hypothetical protein
MIMCGGRLLRAGLVAGADAPSGEDAARRYSDPDGPWAAGANASAAELMQ